MTLKTKAASNVLRLMTGTTIAQAIPIAVSPILTRVYSPEDFGVYALFIAISAIVSSVITGRYELAIMLPTENEDAINIAALCLLIAGVISLLFLLLAVIFGRQISNLLGNPLLYPWLYVLPILLFFNALWNVLNYLNTRLQHYQDIAKSSVYRSVVLGISQIIIGSMRPGVSGLIFGQLLSCLTANGRLLKNIPTITELRDLVSWKKIKINAVRYINFPKFTSWAALATAMTGSLTQMLISVLYSVKTLGFYSLTERALSMPTTVISSAVGQVLFQKASQEKNRSGKMLPIFVKTLLALTVISIPLFTLLYFVVEPLFLFVFGSNWRAAGEFSKALVPLFAVQFIVSPLTMMNIVNEKNKLVMMANFVMLALSAGTIYFCHSFGVGPILMLRTLAIVLSIYYLVYLFITYQGIKGMRCNSSSVSDVLRR